MWTPQKYPTCTSFLGKVPLSFSDTWMGGMTQSLFFLLRPLCFSGKMSNGGLSLRCDFYKTRQIRDQQKRKTSIWSIQSHQHAYIFRPLQLFYSDRCGIFCPLSIPRIDMKLDVLAKQLYMSFCNQTAIRKHQKPGISDIKFTMFSRGAVNKGY